ncbi:MAG: DUF4019 domain-containing protein [Deltaproteobacteria bacterium]|nr:DUF4019 domain-containing protein [Deltaproteobacteria bacterium]
MAMGIVLLAARFASAAGDAKTDAAVKVAEAWLAMVDGGRYDDSWDNAASLFQKAVESGPWSRQLGGVRSPLGKVVKRELLSAKYTTALPGAPDGEYVVIQFKTTFENKKSAIETITPMKDGARGWRVSGYYIK